mgnify:FL=1
MKRNVQISVSLLSLLALLMISTGVSYSLVDQSTASTNQEGNEYSQTDTGEVKFLYTDYDGSGSNLTIADDRIFTDAVGKVLPVTDSANIFDFRIKAETDVSLSYQITLTKEDGSTLEDNFIKVYLTEVNGDTEEEIVSSLNTDGSVKRFSELTDLNVGYTDNGKVEKLLYEGKANRNYEQSFRLRIWVADDAQASVLEDGTIEYSYQGKTFTAKVNVYTTLES